MNKKLLSVSLLLLGLQSYGQVGVGTLTPDPSAQLDVKSNNRGILIPRVGLISSVDTSTIQNGNVNSLLVFNTTTQNDVKPGYYYWYTDRWMRIVNDEDLIALDKNTTNQSLTVIGSNLVLTDSDGNTVSIPLSAINIPTSIVKNSDGTYTYTNEAGNSVVIDATDNVINNIENILSDTNVLNELIQVLGNTYVGGNVYYDGTQFSYVDASGVKHNINFKQLVQDNETVTNLIYDSVTGIAAYTNEKGTVQTINLSAVVKQFETLTSVSVNNTAGTLTYVDEKGNSNVLNLATLIKSQETVTTLVNNNNGTYTYTSENGTVTTVNIPADIASQFNNIVNSGPVTVNGTTYTTIEQYIKDLVAANQTVTNLVYDAATGIATYTNEAGTAQTINLSQVVKDFETLTSLSVDNTAGTLTYTDEAGTTNVLNLATLIKSQETVTTLVNNNNGTYTYTSEDGTVTTVNIPADIVNQFDSIVNNGPVTVDGNTYNTIEEYIKHIVSTSETVTTLVNNNNGTYTYTSENGTVTTVNIPADIASQFNNIVNSGPVTVNGTTYTTIEQYIKDLVTANQTITNLVYDAATGIATYTNEAGTAQTINLSQVVKDFETLTSLSVDNTAGTLTYTDEAGTTNVLNLATLIKSQETVTTLVNNNNGTYTYTSEDGTVTTVNIPADIVNQFDSIVNNGPVTVDGNTYNTIEEYIKHIVSTSETVTTLVNNNNGTYTYTSENGTVTTVNIPADIASQFNNIVNSGPVTVNGTTYTTIEQYIKDLVAANQTVTNLVYDAATGIATYTNEAGTAQTINLSQVVKDFETLTTVSVDNTAGTLTYTDEAGTTNVLNLATLIKSQETVTTLVNNNNGTYTYTSEDGTVTTVNIPADIVNQFDSIVNNGPVTVDGNTYNTIEEYIKHIVSTSETVTTLVNNNNGTYTYTSENGTVTTVNIPADIASQFNNIVNSGPVTVNGTTYTTIEQYIKDLVTANQTITNLVYDAATGIATYTNEAGTAQTINLSQVVKDFETLTSLSVDNIAGTLTYVDEKGNSNLLNLATLIKSQETVTTLVNNNNGTYTYTSEDGTVTTVNIPADIVNQFDSIVNNGPVTVDGNTYNTIEEYIKHIVSTSETVTTLVNNNNGTYTYTSEDGTVTTVNIPADIVNQFDSIVNNGPVTVNGNTYNTIEEYIKHIVSTSETVTTLVNNNNGTYTYTSENGTVTTVNIPADIASQFNNIVNSGPVTVNGTTYTTIEQYIKDLVTANQTVTNLVYDAATGIATYTNEAGTAQTINLSQVVKDFETLTSLSVDNTAGTLTYVDEKGNSNVLNLATLIKSQETVTTLVNNNNGTYTYTSEDGTVTTVNIPADIASQFNNIVNSGPVTVNGTTYTTIEQYIKDLVTANQTVTNLVYDAATGIATYTNEAGTAQTINLSQVVKDFETLTSLSVDNTAGTLTYTDEAGTTNVLNLATLIKSQETVTTLVNNNNGTYTYTSEDGTVTKVNIPADIVNQFDSIVNNGPVTVDGNTYNTIEEYIKHIVSTSETVTTLVNNNNGTYTYTSENGTVTTVNIPADIASQFNNIVNSGPVTVNGTTYTTIEQYIKDLVTANQTVTNLVYDAATGIATYTNEAGTDQTINLSQVVKDFETLTSLSVDNTAGTLTYTDEAGTTNVLNLATLIKSQETVTTLVNNNNGTYTYTSEDGTVTTVNIPADIASQFNNIVNNGPVTVNGNTYNTIEEYIKHIVSTSETVTTLVNNNNGTYTYTSENGTVTTVNIPADIASQFNNIVNSGPVTVNGTTYTTIEQYIKDLVAANQTVTNLVYDAATGIATYTNEAGTAQTINLSQVVKDFETLTSLSVDNTAGTLIYTDEAGTTNVLNLATLIKSQETVTTLVNNNNGTYTYTSEDGTVTTVNIPADIVNQFDSIVNNGPVTVNGNTYNTIEEYIKHIVSTSETVTTLVNNNNGTYTYTSENGTVTTVNIPADIASQFNNIVNSGPVTVNGTTYTTIEQYIKDLVTANQTVTNLVYDAATGIATYTNEAGTAQTINLSQVVKDFETLTSLSVDNTAGTLTYTDEAGTTNVLNLATLIKSQETVTTLVNNNNGTYTYTSEDGTVTTVNIPADIASQFNSIVNSGPVTVNGTTYTTIEQYIKDLVAANQTITNLTYDAVTGIATYTNEAGTAQTIDLSNVVDNFETVTTVAVNNTTGTLTYVDENGVSTVLNLGDLVRAQETLTSMIQNDVTGVITYTPERGTPTTAEVVSADAGNEIKVGTDGGAYYKQANTVANISTSHIVSADDDTLLIDASGSGLTVTLPAAGDNNGRILILRKMDGSGNIITLSEQVTLANGVTFNQFNVQGTMRIQSNGTNWYKID